MKVRSVNELENAVDNEIAWRRHEITQLIRHVRLAAPSNKELYLRAGQALAYAHWEGGIKSLAQLYLQYVNGQKISFSELSSPLLGAALHTRLTAMGEARAAHVHMEFANFMLTDLDSRATVSMDEIRTESNLTSSLFVDILTRLGMDIKAYSTMSKMIDGNY